MKNRWIKTVVLMLAMMFSTVDMTIAEDTAADDDSLQIVEDETESVSPNIEPGIEEDEMLIPGQPSDLIVEGESDVADIQGDTDWNGVQTWRFFIGDAVFSTQEALEGDEIKQPDNPVVPEGMVFDGWYLEDKTSLFTDDVPVTAHPDPSIPNVDAFARFVEADKTIGEQAAEEPAGGSDAEEFTEELAVEKSAEELAVEEFAKEVGEEAVMEDVVGESSVETVTEEGIAETLSGDAETEEAVAQEHLEDEVTEEENGLEELIDELTTEQSVIENSVVNPALDDEHQDIPALAIPHANELTYTGEAQALVTGQGWLYSLDGETYSTEIPTAVNAGEYTVYFKAGEEDEEQMMTITVEKADVELIPPAVAAE